MADSKAGSGGLYLIYCLAFIAGCAIFRLITLLGVTALFAPAGLEEKGFLLQLAAPLAGLAVFQLLFGMTGRWRGWRFWVFAPLIAYPLILAYPVLGLRMANPLLAAGLIAGLLFVAGLIVLQLSPGRTSD